MQKWYYFRSIMTGQVYMLNFVPKFGGYERVTRFDYLEWCQKHGWAPEEEK